MRADDSALQTFNWSSWTKVKTMCLQANRSLFKWNKNDLLAVLLFKFWQPVQAAVIPHRICVATAVPPTVNLALRPSVVSVGLNCQLKWHCHCFRLLQEGAFKSSHCFRWPSCTICWHSFPEWWNSFSRIAHEHAIAGGLSFQEPKWCSSALIGPAASFVGILFPNDGILFPNRPQTSHDWWPFLSRA